MAVPRIFQRKELYCMYSTEAASQRWCRIEGDKETETGRRAMTTACAGIHNATLYFYLHAHILFLGYISAGRC